MYKNRLNCIGCGTELKNLGGDEVVQPVDGMVFQSHGHYGTTFFDPCDGTFIEVVVCDPCLQKHFEVKYL